MIFIQKDDYKTALQCANKAKELNNKNHLNRLLLANIFFELGLLIRALDEAEQAIKLMQQRYDRTFKEAEQIRIKIIEKINETNYSEDDIEKVRYYLDDEKSKRNKGHVIKYNTDRGFGFILSNGNKYFFNINEVNKHERNKIQINTKLEFTASYNKKGAIAINIKIL